MVCEGDGMVSEGDGEMCEGEGMVCEGNLMFNLHILVRFLDVYGKNGGKFTF